MWWTRENSTFSDHSFHVLIYNKKIKSQRNCNKWVPYRLYFEGSLRKRFSYIKVWIQCTRTCIKTCPDSKTVLCLLSANISIFKHIGELLLNQHPVLYLCQILKLQTKVLLYMNLFWVSFLKDYKWIIIFLPVFHSNQATYLDNWIGTRFSCYRFKSCIPNSGHHTLIKKE